MQKAILVSVVLMALASASGALEVKLVVKEPVGSARRAEPISAGVCFKPGEVKDLAKLALFTKGGAAVPCQFSPLVKLEDGSYQWVLADFQCNVGAKGTAEYVVKSGSAAKPAKPVVVTEAGGKYSFKNGPLEFTIDATKPAFELISSLKVAGGALLTGLGKEAMTCRNALDNNKLHFAGKPTKVEFDYRGPMRATLMLEGPYVDEAGKEWLGYRVRVTCYAGLKLIRIEHALRNSCAKQARHAKVREAGLRFGLVKPATGKNNGSWLKAGGVFVKHRLLSGYFSPGLHQLRAEGKQLSLAVVPIFDGYDAKGHRGYNTDKDKKTGSWWSYDCTYKLDEYWLSFGGGDAALAKALDSRLYALAPPAYYSDCAAFSFGPFGTLEDEVATYKKWGWKNIAPRKAALLGSKWIKPMPGYYKAMDFVHGDTETDDAEGCLLMSLRTGGRGYFDAGLAWARYYTNNFIARCDFPEGTKRSRGRKWKFTGKDVGIMQWHASYRTGRTCGCHFYGAGAMDYYVLTGEKSLFGGCRDLARYATRGWMKKTPGKHGVGGWGTRGFGRQFMAAVRFYEITREAKWKQRMEHMAKLALQDPAYIKEDDWGAIHSGGSNSVEKKHCTKLMKKFKRLSDYMTKKGLKWDQRSSTITNAKGKKWAVYDMAGSWEQAYVQQGMERYWRINGNKPAGDYVVRFANFFRKFSWDDHCQQVGYRLWGVHFPEKGQCLGAHAGRWDPAHDKCPGPGAKHSGWYTRFGPDVAARAYNVTRKKKHLADAKMYWNRGSKRGYRRTKQSAPDDAVGSFASHTPPKDDSILSTALMFHLVPRVK
jgi:PcRGLX-like protein central beta sandwich domain